MSVGTKTDPKSIYSGPLNPNDWSLNGTGPGRSLRWAPCAFSGALLEGGQENGEGIEVGAGFGGRGGEVVIEQERENEAFAGGGCDIAGQGVDVGEGAGLGEHAAFGGRIVHALPQRAVDTGDGQAGSEEFSVPVFVHGFQQGNDRVGSDHRPAGQTRSFIQSDGVRRNSNLAEKIRKFGNGGLLGGLGRVQRVGMA